MSASRVFSESELAIITAMDSYENEIQLANNMAIDSINNIIADCCLIAIETNGNALELIYSKFAYYPTALDQVNTLLSLSV